MVFLVRLATTRGRFGEFYSSLMAVWRFHDCSARLIFGESVAVINAAAAINPWSECANRVGDLDR